MRHLFLDLFGTLLHPSQGARWEGVRALSHIFPRTQKHIAVALSRSFDDFEAACASSFAEYAMEDVIQRTHGLLGLEPLSSSDLCATTQKYLEAWSRGIAFDVTALDALRGLGIPFSVVTNTHSRYLIDHCVAKMGEAMLGVPVCTSIELGHRKPHPTIYRLALEQANCLPSDGLFVGDDYVCDYMGPSNIGLESHLLSPTPDARVPKERQHLHLQAFLDSLMDRCRTSRRPAPGGTAPPRPRRR